jgi:dTDP-3-amino-3,4,6-trideoxy-alpha-D-glucose transaminase
VTLPAVPPADPRAAYLARKAEIDGAIAGMLARGTYILGEEVDGFEREFAAYIGAKACIGVANGTDALHLALRACGVGPGDEVVTVSHTAVATVAAIELSGATPVLVDIGDTFTMDPEAVRDALGPRTKAIVPVHLYGLPADLAPLLALARERGLKVVEDCAQSHGARYKGARTGSQGDLAAFSFYPTKNLGAFGDGGAITTGDAALAERVRLLREYGWRRRYISEIPGVNSRLDEMQAAILRVQLRHLDSGNTARQALAALYDRSLRSSCVTLPAAAPGLDHVYHQYVVRHPRRDALREHLKTQGIGTLIHYPLPVHLQPAYAGRLRTVGSMEKTEQAAASVLSLPMFPELTEEQARRTAAAVLAWNPA